MGCTNDCEMGSFDDPIWKVGNGPVTVGRNDMPLRVWDAFHSNGGLLDSRRLRTLLADAWTMAEFPAVALDPFDWEEMFRTAGWVTDCRRCRRPRQPKVLWRGCGPGAERGMSWSGERHIAVKFAGYRRPGGVLARVVAPPEAMLGHIRHGREECEFILDPSFLGVAEITTEDWVRTEHLG